MGGWFFDLASPPRLQEAPSRRGARPQQREMGRAAGEQLWIQNGDQKIQRSPCAQVTERETEAQGIRSARTSNELLASPTCSHSHNPPWSGACLPLKSTQSLGPGRSPALPHPVPHTEVRAIVSRVFIAWQALSPLVSQHATYLGGIRSQELSEQSSFRLWCPAGPTADRVEVGREPGPSLC